MVIEAGYDPDKYYVGTLCKRNHRFNNENKSLRSKKKDGVLGGDCRQCAGIKQAEGFARRGGYKKNGNIKTICASCGEVIYRYSSGIAEKNYCSLQCWHNRRNKVATINNSRVCPVCGEVFVRKKHRLTDAFCSRDCFGVSNRGNRYLINCRYCEKEFEVPEYKYGKTKFCSQGCLLDYRRERKTHLYDGYSTPNYKRKYSQKRSHWKRELELAKSKPEAERREIEELIDINAELKIINIDISNARKGRV
jgi:endogenous inhibitor of DNA gyrase (YacG/DUF329 family)